jgi:hypothetical protein
MQTVTLVIGLVQLFGSLCCYASGCLYAEAAWAKAVWFLGGMVNGVLGANSVCEALFGARGMISPLSRWCRTGD